jgi:acyl dehydratase
MDTFYLDDLTVGQRFVSGSHTMDAAEIQQFATRYDPQPFHMDDAAARGTLFGGLVASGWHTAGTTMRLIVSGGRSRCARAIRCMSNARCSKSRHPAPSPIAAPSSCAA